MHAGHEHWRGAGSRADLEEEEDTTAPAAVATRGHSPPPPSSSSPSRRSRSRSVSRRRRARASTAWDIVVFVSLCFIFAGLVCIFVVQVRKIVEVHDAGRLETSSSGDCDEHTLSRRDLEGGPSRQEDDEGVATARTGDGSIGGAGGAGVSAEGLRRLGAAGGHDGDGFVTDIQPLFAELAAGHVAPVASSYGPGEDPLLAGDAARFRDEPKAEALRNIMAELAREPEAAGLSALDKACDHARDMWNAGRWLRAGLGMRSEPRAMGRLFTSEALDELARGEPLATDPTVALCRNLARSYIKGARRPGKAVADPAADNRPWYRLVPVFVDTLLPEVAEVVWASPRPPLADEIDTVHDSLANVVRDAGDSVSASGRGHLAHRTADIGRGLWPDVFTMGPSRLYTTALKRSALNNVWMELGRSETTRVSVEAAVLGRACEAAEEEWNVTRWAMTSAQVWSPLGLGLIKVGEEQAARAAHNGSARFRPLDMLPRPVMAVCDNIQKFYVGEAGSSIWSALMPVWVEKVLVPAMSVDGRSIDRGALHEAMEKVLGGRKGVAAKPRAEEIDSSKQLGGVLSRRDLTSDAKTGGPEPLHADNFEMSDLTLALDGGEVTAVVDPLNGVTLYHNSGETTQVGKMKVRIPGVATEADAVIEYELLFDYLQRTMAVRNAVALWLDTYSLVPENAEELDEVLRRCLTRIFNRPGGFCEKLWREIAVEWGRRYDYVKHDNLPASEVGRFIIDNEMPYITPEIPQPEFTTPPRAPAWTVTPTNTTTSVPQLTSSTVAAQATSTRQPPEAAGGAGSGNRTAVATMTSLRTNSTTQQQNETVYILLSTLRTVVVSSEAALSSVAPVALTTTITASEQQQSKYRVTSFFVSGTLYVVAAGPRTTTTTAAAVAGPSAVTTVSVIPLVPTVPIPPLPSPDRSSTSSSSITSESSPPSPAKGTKVVLLDPEQFHKCLEAEEAALKAEAAAEGTTELDMGEASRRCGVWMASVL